MKCLHYISYIQISNNFYSYNKILIMDMFLWKFNSNLWLQKRWTNSIKFYDFFVGKTKWWFILMQPLWRRGRNCKNRIFASQRKSRKTFPKRGRQNVWSWFRLFLQAEYFWWSITNNFEEEETFFFCGEKLSYITYIKYLK